MPTDEVSKGVPLKSFGFIMGKLSVTAKACLPSKHLIVFFAIFFVLLFFAKKKDLSLFSSFFLHL